MGFGIHTLFVYRLSAVFLKAGSGSEGGRLINFKGHLVLLRKVAVEILAVNYNFQGFISI